jgi:transposase
MPNGNVLLDCSCWRPMCWTLQVLSDDQILREYKAQQSTERGFRSLKDPLFFTSSVFLKTPQRVAALAMLMGLCLLVYSLGQRSLRQALDRAQQTIDNQVGKPTAKPTLRWVFQCFMSIHLLTINGVKYITNLTQERLWIIQFFGAPCRKYYLLS